MTSIPKPMLAQSSDDLPVGRTWTYEVKWDGYRVQAVVADGVGGQGDGAWASQRG